MIPGRYERQLDLPAGEYELRLVISDGDNLGRLKIPLKVKNFDLTQLGISDIFLCKNFGKAPDAPRGPAEAPQYVPMVSNGLEFSAAGETRFSKGERLTSYFEVYVPLGGTVESRKLQLQMKETDIKSGKLISDTGLRPVESEPRVGSSTVPLVREIDLAELASGSYRLEAQASDSAGNKTEWRAATFTVQ